MSAAEFRDALEQHLGAMRARDGGPAVREESVLTLAFRRQQGGWRMIFDQDTPCRS